MLIICDHRLPASMRPALEAMGEVVWFHGPDVYNAISGHPDIFVCLLPEQLVVAPNMPQEVLRKFNQHKIAFVIGEKPAGNSYPESARFNALAAHGLFIHNLSHTDPVLLKETGTLKPVHVRQGYVRCNLLSLPDGSFITSDSGILKTLSCTGSEIYYFNPEEIRLDGFGYGFLGGTAGWNGSTLVFAGHPRHLKEGGQLMELLHKKNISWVSLSDEPLWDAGGLFFLETN
ncbi:MAG: hypothetical protein CVU06_09305 [Bacteroidetes bacterium HGW-Bacteroidetes-22]|nr:MAG: hypothetical protein CVU06_09305 [Bacteroidetes bacterium HGW-Bacteroidetes-22]